MDEFDALKAKTIAFLQQQAEVYGAENLLLGVDTSALSAQPQPGAAVPVIKPLSTPAREASAPIKNQTASLVEFFHSIKNCEKCALAKSRKNFVFGTGNPQARVMFIGEGPGREEDLQGKPFVGAAGQVLDRMLKKMGFARNEVFIANIVKCRPPQNRNPEPEEAAECLPHLQKQIALIQPLYIFCLGKIAAKYLLGLEGSLASLRTKNYVYEGITTFVTYHPAALLRQQSLFWQVFEDMKKFRKDYDQKIGDKPPMV